MIYYSHDSVKQIIEKSKRWGVSTKTKIPLPVINRPDLLVYLPEAKQRLSPTHPYLSFHLGYDAPIMCTWVGLDIDNITDTDTAVISEVLNLFPAGYVETSISGTGVHLIFPIAGDVLSEYCVKRARFEYKSVVPLELYFKDRHFVFSGKSVRPLEESETTVEECICNLMKLGVLEKVARLRSQHDNQGWSVVSPVRSDVEVLRSIYSTTGKWFKAAYTSGKLWEVKTTSSPSASEYIYAVCAAVVRHTQDREQVKRILLNASPKLWSNISEISTVKGGVWVPSSKNSKFDRLILTDASSGNVLDSVYNKAVEENSFFVVTMSQDAPNVAFEMLSDLTDSLDTDTDTDTDTDDTNINFFPISEVIQNAHIFVSKRKREYVIGDNQYYRYNKKTGLYVKIGIERDLLEKLRVFYSYLTCSSSTKGGELPSPHQISAFAKQVNDELRLGCKIDTVQNHTWIFNRQQHVLRDKHHVCLKLNDCIYDLIQDVVVPETSDFFAYSTIPLSASDLLSDAEYKELYPQSKFYNYLRTSLYNEEIDEDDISNSSMLKETIRCLQIAFGYLMIPRSQSEQFTTSGAVMLKGVGGSGKSLMLKILRALFGGDEELSCNITGADLTSDTGLHDLPGKRFIFIEELDAVFNSLAQTRFKALVTNESVTRVQKYEPTISKVWNVKLVCTCNDVIRTYSGDSGDALQSRLYYFNFPNAFRGTELEDPTLLHTITTEELPIVLKWLSIGVRAYLREGKLITPASSKSVVTEQRRGVNPYFDIVCEIFEFLEDDDPRVKYNSSNTTIAVPDVRMLVQHVMSIAKNREMLVSKRLSTTDLNKVFNYDFPKLMKDTPVKYIRAYHSNRVQVDGGSDRQERCWTNIIIREDSLYYNDIKQFLPENYLTDIQFCQLPTT
jgi:hypothetical protein